MLLLFVALPALFALCSIVGVAAASFDRLTLHLRAHEQLALFFWLGLALLAVLAEAVSLVGPVRPTILVVAGGVAGVVILLRRDARAHLAEVARLFAWNRGGFKGVAAAAITLLGVAATHSVLTIYFDTRHYHYQAIHWFSTHGAVSGLGLLHVRLGFGTAWLPFLAAFDAGPGEARLLGLGSALILFASLLFWAFAAARCFARRADRSDHFLAFLVPALIAQPWIGWQFNSASPDLAAVFMGSAVAWLMLALCDRWSAWQTLRSRPAVFDGSALFALACAAGSMKLSGIIIPLVTGAFFVTQFRVRSARLLAMVVVGAALFAPLLLFGLKTTGAPLFPMDVLAMHGPSALTSTETGAIAEVVRTNPYLADTLEATPDSFAAIFRLWARQLRFSSSFGEPGGAGWLSKADSGKIYTLAFPVLLALAVMSTVILLRRGRRSRGAVWLLSFAWVGIIFWLVSAPNLRFGALYLTMAAAMLVGDDLIRSRGVSPMFVLAGGVGAILVLRSSYVHFMLGFPGYPAFVVAWVATAHVIARRPCSERRICDDSSRVQRRTLGVPGLLVCVGVVTGVCLHLPGPDDSFRHHLIVPATLGSFPWKDVRSNDVVYHLVAGECRAVPLPCAQTWNDPAWLGIRLRDPQRGMAGGFARTTR